MEAVSYQTWLEDFVTKTGAVAGTVHLHQMGGLKLVAAVNIPEQVRQVVDFVPSGKGMAGLALERGETAQTCNLKDDRNGKVRPGAKAVNAKAAVAMPVRDPKGSIIAIVGIAFLHEHEMSEQELAQLSSSAISLREVQL